MKIGTVKFYNEEKKFGFIKQPDGEDVFVHVSGIPSGGPLLKDQKVSFDTVETEKGLQAQNVELAD